MKAKLIFNLPEERDEFNDAINGAKFSSAVWDFDNKLRSKYKHEDIESMTIEEVRSLLRETLDEYNLKIE